MITYEVTVDAAGTKRWYNKKGQLHNEHGPAVEYANGSKFWYVEEELHRLDGPAIEYANGNKFWYVEGKEQEPLAVMLNTKGI